MLAHCEDMAACKSKKEMQSRRVYRDINEEIEEASSEQGSFIVQVRVMGNSRSPLYSNVRSRL